MFSPTGAAFALTNPVDRSKAETYMMAEGERIQNYRKAREAYDGVLPDPFGTRAGDIRDQVKVNRVKPIVSATVNWLFGTPPQWELPEDIDGEDEPNIDADDMSDREAWLSACLAANRWESLLLDLGINGAICGTAYIAIDLSALIPNPDEPARAFPRLHVLDPADMTIKWAYNDIDQVIGYVWKYNTYDDQQKKPVIFRRRVDKQDNGRWLITDERSYTPNLAYEGDWIADGPPVLWPFDWPPIIHCKNLPCPNEVYGEPDVTPVIVALNKARNFNLSNWSRIVRKHAQPKPWVKGMGGKSINLDSEVIDLPSKDADMGQLTPVIDGASSDTLGRVIDEAICEESQTPSLVLGRPDQQGTPSGVALRIKMWPLINKTATKQALYGPMMVELFRRLFEAANYGPRNVVTLKWAEALPTDPLQERQVYALDLEMGIASKQTVAQKLGYDYDNEQQNIMCEAQMGEQPAVSGMKPAGTPNMANVSERMQSGVMQGAQGQGQGDMMMQGAQSQAARPAAANPKQAGQKQAQIEAQMQQRMQGYLAQTYDKAASAMEGR